MRHTHGMALLGLAIVLAGCVGDRLTHAEMLRDGWLFAATAGTPSPLWNYRTPIAMPPRWTMAPAACSPPRGWPHGKGANPSPVSRGGILP